MRGEPSRGAMLGALLLLAGTCGHTEEPSGEHVVAVLGAARCADAEAAAGAPVAFFEQALAEALSAGAPDRQAEARRCLGISLRLAGRGDDARAQLESALAQFEALGDRKMAGSVHNSLGNLAYYRSRGEARGHFSAALEAAESSGEAALEMVAIHNLVLVSDTPEEGLAWIRRGLGLARRRGDTVMAGGLLRSQGDLLANAGRLDEALESLDQALATVRSGRPDPRADDLEVTVLTSLGQFHSLHGVPEKAREYHLLALEKAQVLGDEQVTTQALYMVGKDQQALGRAAEARGYYERALARGRASASTRVVLHVLSDLASLELDDGNAARARELLAEPLRQLEAVDALFPRTLMAQALRELGQPRAALAEVDAVLATPGIEERLYRFVAAQAVRAQVLQELGQSEDALAAAQSAIARIEDARAHLAPSDFLRQGFGSFGQQLFALTVRLLHELGRDREAFESADLARGRAFLDLLASRRRPPAEPAGHPTDPAPRAAPPWLSQRPPTFADAVATARRLSSPVLSFFVTSEATFAWVVSPDGQVKGLELPLRKERLALLVDQARGAGPHAATRAGRRVASRGGTLAWPGREAHEAWRTLYDSLAAPLLPFVGRGTSRLVVVPHGPLLLLPFGALRGPSGRYLLEDYSVVHAPAIGAFSPATTRLDVPTKGKSLVVADPAPLPREPDGTPLGALQGSRVEARLVSRLLPEPTVLLGRAATKEAFVSLAGGAPVLHVATHGLALEDRPLESFLAFSAENDDGRLTAGDVSALRLGADLVVLSACRTASGRVSPDGVLGLTRAFLVAGAASVVATTWDIPDEAATVELVAEFYRGLARALPRDEALRRAQLRLLRRLRAGRVSVPGPLGPVPLPEDPVLWAGFELIGEP